MGRCFHYGQSRVAIPLTSVATSPPPPKQLLDRIDLHVMIPSRQHQSPLKSSGFRFKKCLPMLHLCIHSLQAYKAPRHISFLTVTPATRKPCPKPIANLTSNHTLPLCTQPVNLVPSHCPIRLDLPPVYSNLAKLIAVTLTKTGPCSPPPDAPHPIHPCRGRVRQRQKQEGI